MTVRFVNVSVESVHIDASEKPDVINSFAIGKLDRYKDKIYISYEEPAETGIEKTKSILKIDGETVTLTRTGEIEQKLEFKKDIISDSVYKTPFGSLRISVDTRSLDIVFEEDTITIYIEYILLLNGELQGLTKMRIWVREDNKFGH